VIANCLDGRFVLQRELHPALGSGISRCFYKGPLLLALVLSAFVAAASASAWPLVSRGGLALLLSWLQVRHLKHPIAWAQLPATVLPSAIASRMVFSDRVSGESYLARSGAFALAPPSPEDARRL